MWNGLWTIASFWGRPSSITDSLLRLHFNADLEIDLGVELNGEAVSSEILYRVTRNLPAINFETELVDQCGNHFDHPHRAKQTTLL